MKQNSINKLYATGTIILGIIMSCSGQRTENKKMVQLITLDPGHFHAALVQKTMYNNVDSVVYVYAPTGNDLKLHLDRINAYNSRKEAPTGWKQKVYAGHDFFEKMIAEKQSGKDQVWPAKVVVISGNNQKKASYILQALQNGFNVLADKPMAINTGGFEQLKIAFDVAAKNNLLLYDIMTERFEITSILQRELSMIPEILGILEKGTVGNPAITKESVHHFYKFVSGNVLTRPSWFMDVTQQGEGIVDVTTHLVDLVQWTCFPGQIIDYKKDIDVVAAKHWQTSMTAAEYKLITKSDSFPSYLKKDLSDDTTLQVYCNGEISYRLRGIYAKVSVQWNYKAPEGAGDTHYSVMRGTKANLVIKQGAEQQYKPALYIEPVINDDAFANALMDKLAILQSSYPGVELKKSAKGWEVIIASQYKENHEEHFARVTKKFLEYLENKNMPAWEIPNMLVKYYVTTKALETAKKSNQLKKMVPFKNKKR